MAHERVEFSGHNGDMLAARLDLPQSTPLAVALFAHCFTCTKDIPAAKRISERLTTMGLAVLRFDFTGLGHSGGEFANTTFTSNVEDLKRAATYLEGRGLAPSLLIGHSLGGAAVLKAAGEIASCRGVVTLGAPADPAHVVENFGASLDEIRKNGEAEVQLAGRPFTIKSAFLDDVAGSSLNTAIGNLHKALLVLHAPGDQIVGIENASEIFMAAKHPKSFVTLDDADHLISKAKDAEYAADVIAAWSGRYLDLQTPDAPTGAPEGIVRTTERSPNGFLQDIQAGPAVHVLADEPLSVGGTGRGLTPYQFLSAGLGACTSMTLRMYAERKKWPMTGVSVDVTHDKIHATDCEHCDTTTGKVDNFQRIIRIEGDLDDDQRARLLEIADRCPVHRSLGSEIVVETKAG